MIKNEHRSTLFEGSWNVYVTLVSPMGKNCPGKCVLPTFTKPELSVAVGFGHVTGRLVSPREAVLLISPGHSVTGGMLST